MLTESGLMNTSPNLGKTSFDVPRTSSLHIYLQNTSIVFPVRRECSRWNFVAIVLSQCPVALFDSEDMDIACGPSYSSEGGWSARSTTHIGLLVTDKINSLSIDYSLWYCLCTSRNHCWVRIEVSTHVVTHR
jgi:hypothetical protein